MHSYCKRSFICYQIHRANNRLDILFRIVSGKMKAKQNYRYLLTVNDLGIWRMFRDVPICFFCFGVLVICSHSGLIFYNIYSKNTNY